MRIFKSSMITFATNIAIFGVSILNTVITSRILGTEGKGVLGLVTNIISFSVLIMALGVEASNIYYIGKDRKNLNSVLGIDILIAVFSAIMCSILFLVNKYFGIVLFNKLDGGILIIIFIVIPFYIIKNYFVSVLLAIEDYIQYNKINLIDRILSFLLLVVSLVLFKSTFWAVLTMLISSIILVALLVYILLFKMKLKPSLNKEVSTLVVKYGIKNQISNIVQMLNYRLDIFIITYFLNIAQVGIYSSAVAFGETIWQISGSIATIVFPMASNCSDKTKLKSSINKITRITFNIGLIGCIFLVLISKPVIVFLLGKEFAMASIALIWLIPGICVFSISKILANYLSGIGLAEKNIIASSASCIATLILDVVLIPKMGIIGASLATSISYFLFTAIIVYYYFKETNAKLNEILILTKEDISDIKNVIKNLILKIYKR